MHSFIEQCFARSSIDTIWWYLTLKISGRYNPIVSIEDCSKCCFKKRKYFRLDYIVPTNLNGTLQFEPFHGFSL